VPRLIGARDFNKSERVLPVLLQRRVQETDGLVKSVFAPKHFDLADVFLAHRESGYRTKKSETNPNGPTDKSDFW
jgi:hypothetical protein